MVKTLDTLCDIIIVSFHGGAEGSYHTHVPKKTEWYLGENRGDVYHFSHALIDAGADIIFGHGPHVTRAIELYKNRIIAYSLGNFCTYGRFNLKGPCGIAPILKVFTDKNGKFLSAKVYSTKQIGQGGPIIDESETVYKAIQNLTLTDFPTTPLQFKENGFILPAP